MILLIEDEPGIVDFVKRGLEAEGFPVQAALDGVQGERRALGESFDLIVLDLMLPGRDSQRASSGTTERSCDCADRAG
jgi:DNA-binding response OmpR family regulator